MKNGCPDIKEVKSNNKKVVNKYLLDGNGDLFVYLKGKGKATITTKLRGGKKYKTKITANVCYPYFDADLVSYRTRNNFFSIKVKNTGNKKLTIIRKGSKAINELILRSLIFHK